MFGSAEPISATTYQFETTNPLDVSVRNHSGTVELTASDVSETTVEIVPNDAEGVALAQRTTVVLSQDGGHLRIDVPDRKDRRQPPLEIIVTLPTRSTVHVQTATAQVQTRGIFGDTTVATASADVSLSHVAGRSDVTSASGDVHIGRSEGPAQVRTASGDVRLDSSDVEAAISTASGDVLLGRVSGALSVRTASGDVIAATIDRGSVQAKTMSGDVILGVAPGLLLFLDVHSLSGDVTSQLGPDDSAEGDEDAESHREPDLRISASTMSGDVLLRRGR